MTPSQIMAVGDCLSTVILCALLAVLLWPRRRHVGGNDE